MGDRFYLSQNGKVTGPKRTKAGWVDAINRVLGSDINGLDKCTIATLTSLYEALGKNDRGT